MLENKFQANLIKELKERFPGCIVMKNDPTYIQGIPDLLVLNKDKWAESQIFNDASLLFLFHKFVFTYDPYVGDTGSDRIRNIMWIV